MSDHGDLTDRERLVDEMERQLARSMSRDTDQRPDRDMRKTVDEVFDESTLLTLYKLMTAGHIDSVDYPVSTGKEANVFHATTDGGEPRALKIFRVNTATFRSFMTYIHGDPRFRHVGPNRRDVVHEWTKKEQRNLSRLHEHGFPVPEPHAYRNNVLIMEFIGDEGTPAPRMKDLPPEDPEEAYHHILGIVGDMMAETSLVHGDLSEFNILHRPHAATLEERFVVIDVAQGVLKEHPMAGELLKRDVDNLVQTFRRLGVDATEEEAWDRVVRDLDEEALAEVKQP